MKKIGWAVLALCATGFAQENLATWSKYKNITVNTKASGANVANVVTKFPVLVRLDSVNAPDVFAGAAAGGADIRFAKPDGTQRPYEIDSWDAVAKQAAIWVLADTVKGNDSSVALRLYWGKSTATAGSNAGAVYDTANGYVGNWHLGNASGLANRPNAVNGAPAAVLRSYLTGYTAVPGVIGLADTLFGDVGDSTAATARYIDMRATSYAGYRDFTGGFTFSTWIRPTALTQFVRMLEMLEDSTKAIANVSATRAVLFLNHSSAANGISVRWGSQTAYNSGANLVTAGSWQHVVIARPGGAAVATAYVNGVSVGTTPSFTDLAVVDRPYVRLGRSFSTDAYFNGKFDEVSIAKVARSADWVKLSYETQKPTAAALGLGTTQTQSVPLVALSKLAYVDTLKAADTLSYRVNTVVSRAAIVSGGTPDSIKVVGTALPAGLTINKASGLLSGTPTTVTAAANYTVRAWGHAAAGDSLTRTVRLTITAIPTLSYAKDSVVYVKDSLFTANNATTNLTSPAFTVTPALPAGLSLSATTGAISGTATTVTAIAAYTVKAISGTDTVAKTLYLSVINKVVGIAGAKGDMALGFNVKPGTNGMVFALQGVNAGDKAVLTLVDMAGHSVYSAAFANGNVLNWNGRTASGQTASAGIYVARVTVTSAQGKLRQVLENRVPFTK